MMTVNALRIIRSDHILIMIIHNDVQLLGSAADICQASTRSPG